MAFFDVFQFADVATPMGRSLPVRIRPRERERQAGQQFLEAHRIEKLPGCWYCGKEANQEVDIALQKGVVQAHRIFMDLVLPTCATCRDLLAERARSAFRGLLITFATSALLMVGFAVFFSPPGTGGVAFGVGAFLALLFGPLLGCAAAWIPVKVRAAKVAACRSELEHPGVRAALQEGWGPRR